MYRKAFIRLNTGSELFRTCVLTDQPMMCEINSNSRDSECRSVAMQKSTVLGLIRRRDQPRLKITTVTTVKLWYEAEVNVSSFDWVDET